MRLNFMYNFTQNYFKLAILGTFILLVFSGCSLKFGVPAATMYEIYYSKKECAIYDITRKNIYIESVSALDMVDTRQILVVAENNQIRYLKDAKFVSLPSEMIYKALVKGAYSNCHAKPIFAPNPEDLRLKVSVISLQIRGDKAEVSLAYELFNASKSIKSGMINKELFCPDPSSKMVFDTINNATNLAIDELLEQII
ncbi:ABC-type transport auxiliary lipoprotein family protein [Campylobacter anatolicus]|uniref:ABC-type transport auxiliary lipoprotein family protein n=1 Tax=Campylobacter anatolicus TaxID=2829105 RepID=UPI001E2EC44C|nr:ABC-type transport auxiliary lipoprotein family protein [Campylobacter anatolicus]